MSWIADLYLLIFTYACAVCGIACAVGNRQLAAFVLEAAQLMKLKGTPALAMFFSGVSLSQSLLAQSMTHH